MTADALDLNPAAWRLVTDILEREAEERIRTVVESIQ